MKLTDKQFSTDSLHETSAKCMIVEEVEQVVYEEGKLMQRVLTWTAVKEKKGREESEIL